MKHTYHIRMRGALSVALAILWSGPVVAQSCRVQCGGGVSVIAPCNTRTDPCPRPESRPSSPAPGGGGPNIDYGAIEAERLRLQAEAAEAERQRQAEADRIERERFAEEKRKKDAEFIRNRDATARTLRGGIGTTVVPNDGGLRGSSTIDTGLRELRSTDRVARDLQGPQAAWKQLHCAAALSGYAFAALSKPTPDYQESSYLAGQASKAMAGESLGVDCGKAPPMPDLRGTADLDRLRQTQQRMIERASTLSERIQAGQQARAKYEPARALTPDEQRIQEVFRQQQENQARLVRRDAPVIAAQNAINRAQERKYDPKDAAAIREEQKAKVEINKYVDASKKLESGDPSAMLNLGISLGEEAPRAPRRGAAAP